MTDDSTGYASLLGRRDAAHWVLFVCDFSWDRQLESHVESAVSIHGYRVRFVRINQGKVNFLAILSGCMQWGIDPTRDYVSLQVLHCSYAGYAAAATLASFFRHHDLCRLELPILEMGFRPEYATRMVEIVRNSDYSFQETAARHFFSCLSEDIPYALTLCTGCDVLSIRDDQPWTQIAGPLVPGERRLLPGGEVAYTGSQISGSFTADGAILPTPQSILAVPIARELIKRSERLRHDPVTFDVEGGRVVRIHSKEGLADELRGILTARGFQELTEVGISFNGACKQFIHDWPASCNEGHPGIHIGIGGEPAPTAEDCGSPHEMVHVDFIASSGTVMVNNRRFMIDGSVDG